MLSMSLVRLIQVPCSSKQAASAFSTSTLAHSHRQFSSSQCRKEAKGKQPQTPATDNIELSSPAIFVSQSQDPWFNLSYEDWLLRTTPRDQPVLFLYRNTPCVVIGRNQNPWKESTPRYLRSKDIPLIRRRSGGGTVFHDLGNTNFSIILPRLLFTRAHGAELVARAVREKLGISTCTVNDRNDVIIRTATGDFKVSGSAYKIIQHRAYHHGTMLISSDLSNLGQALRSNSPNLETKGIPSFRSPVTTLNAHLPKINQAVTHEDFVKAVTSEFNTIYGSTGRLDPKVVSNEHDMNEKIRNGVEELKSSEWTYGQTPEFSNILETTLSVGTISVSLKCRKCLMTEITFNLTPSTGVPFQQARQIQSFLDALALSLIGKHYESLEGDTHPLPMELDMVKNRELETQILEWLRGAM